MQKPTIVFEAQLTEEQPWETAPHSVPIWIELIIYGAGIGAFLWFVLT